MGERRKVIKRDIINIKYCDTCGQDHGNVKVLSKCTSCKDDICNDCLTIINGVPVCKKCKESCPGCNEYAIYTLKGQDYCPNCGYNLKNR